MQRFVRVRHSRACHDSIRNRVGSILSESRIVYPNRFRASLSRVRRRQVGSQECSRQRATARASLHFRALFIRLIILALILILHIFLGVFFGQGSRPRMWASTPWAICRTDRLSTIDYRQSPQNVGEHSLGYMPNGPTIDNRQSTMPNGPTIDYRLSFRPSLPANWSDGR